MVLIGYDAIEFEPKFWNVGRNKKIVHIGSVPLETVPNLEPELQLVGNLEKLLLGLCGVSKKRSNWALELRSQLEEMLNARSEDGGSIEPRSIVKAIRASLRRDDIAVSDVGAHLLWMIRSYRS